MHLSIAIVRTPTDVIAKVTSILSSLTSTYASVSLFFVRLFPSPRIAAYKHWKIPAEL